MQQNAPEHDLARAAGFDWLNTESAARRAFEFCAARIAELHQDIAEQTARAQTAETALRHAKSEHLEEAALICDDHAQTWGLALGSPAIELARAIRAQAKKVPLAEGLNPYEQLRNAREENARLRDILSHDENTALQQVAFAEAEIARLRTQCEGMANSALANGQGLLIEEAGRKRAEEILRDILLHLRGMNPSVTSGGHRNGTLRNRITHCLMGAGGGLREDNTETKEAVQTLPAPPACIHLTADMASNCPVCTATQDQPVSVEDLIRERDEADRRAGAAERDMERLKESAAARAQWLSRAKGQRGYDDHISFDHVWKDTCEAADASGRLTADLAASQETIAEMLRAMEALCTAYAACNGEDHPAYVQAIGVMAQVRAKSSQASEGDAPC